MPSSSCWHWSAFFRYGISSPFHSAHEAVSANAVGLVPVNFTTATYTKIIEDAQFWRSFGISVLRVVLLLCLTWFPDYFNGLIRYPNQKEIFKGRNIYMNIMIFAMLFSGGMIPSYLLIKNLDMLNTIWALVLPGAVPIFSVILVMNFFSAYLKRLKKQEFHRWGQPLQVLFKVYVPVSILHWRQSPYSVSWVTWNDFFGGLIYMTKVSNYPLMTYIQSLNVNIADLLQAGTNSSELSNLTEISNKNLMQPKS